MIPKKITVIVDTREIYPILFPGTVAVVDPDDPKRMKRVTVETRKEKMDAGDYCLAEWPHLVGIERKASLLELSKNLTDPGDKARQGKSLTKLIESCKYPYLLVEAPPSELLGSDPRVKDSNRVVSLLCKAAYRYRLQLIMMPWKSRSAETRRKMGTFLVHLMLTPILEGEV